MIGINVSLFSCWRSSSMTRHSCQGFSRTLCFWQGKQLQSEVCWLLSKYIAPSFIKVADTLQKLQTENLEGTSCFWKRYVKTSNSSVRNSQSQLLKEMLWNSWYVFQRARRHNGFYYRSMNKCFFFLICS